MVIEQKKGGRRMKKRIVGILLTICLILGLIPPSMASASSIACIEYTGNNMERQNYSRWSRPIYSYLSTTEDGNLMRVQYEQYADAKEITVQYYDASYNIIDIKKIPEELPIFGGFYETDSNYFLLTGQSNKEESPNIEVFRITKYDKAWNRITSTGLYDCNTVIPFDSGCARMEESGKYLLIRTCHKMYKYSDGLNHQANVTIQLDMEKMEITDSYTEIMDNEHGYVSHSFNQFIKVENNHIIAVEHGDATPRAIVLLKYKTDMSEGKFTPDYRTKCDVVNILAFPGERGQNNTGASVGGFEISNSSYLVAGSSVVQDEKNLEHVTRNIFVAAVDKETSEVTTNWITNYAEGENTASTPHLVKIAEDRYILLWSREEERNGEINREVYYTEIDGLGKPVGEMHHFVGQLSDCVPIVFNHKLVWYTYEKGISTHYGIDLADLSRTESKIVMDGHDYEKESISDGYVTLICKKCKATKQLREVTYFKTAWRENGSSGAYSSQAPSGEQLVGSALDYWIAWKEPSDSYDDMIIEVSNPELIRHTKDENTINMGTFTMLKEGTATVKIYPKYNEELAEEYIFTIVAHHHDYEWISIDENGLATLQCKICSEPKQVQAMTDFSINWQEGYGGFSDNVSLEQVVGNELYFLLGNFTPSEADQELCVEISNPEIISLEFKRENQGRFKILKEGTATVKIYPRCNPKLAKEYVFTVNSGEEKEVLELKSAALKLENDITVLFKASATLDDAGYHDYYVEVVQQKENGETETATIQGVKSEDGQFYEFPYTGVNAKETGDSINATIFAYDADNNLVQGKTKENYSVKEYCMNQLKKTSAELTEMGLSEEKQTALRTLLVDILNYSAEAQKYFNYKAETLANADLTSEQAANASDDTVIAQLQNIMNAKQAEIENPLAAWKAVGLNLLSKTTIRVKFAYDGDITQASMAATVGAEEGNEGANTTEITEFTSLGNNLYYAYFDNVPAFKFGVPVDFTLKVNNQPVSNTLRYSVESYAALAKDNETVGNVVRAMMKYGKAAQRYQNCL